ncbi:protein phosphatase 2C domain-containing protein [Alkalimonas sp. MEB108]|uniref:Protein phosphatase 2C domain-containing protein n=1 Tax=Alkalimonas cellulosilytica TaxID=3058395 RepID=A0ABU7J9Z7_9GAMM|nr:protein phosphatase 2C domain-containing protein [Alkalimonas sp. MEB108]MEE2003369.1 protein phosphatase 2C domain-containing protein [Alkalimonas sp. MEB108]
MQAHLALLQLSGFNAIGGKLQQQDAIGYCTGSAVQCRVQQQSIQQQEFSDCIDLADSETLLLVADGVSSNPAAAKASRVVVNNLIQQWQKEPFSSKHLRAAQLYLSESLGTKRQSFGAATTIAALALSKSRFVAINAGNSRVWRLRQGQLLQLSIDHTFQNDSPELKQQSNLAQCYQALTSYLAADNDEADFTIAFTDGAVAAKDEFLLTSDGVHDVISTEELSEMMQQSSMTFALEQVRKRLLDRSAPDNASLLWLRLAG